MRTLLVCLGMGVLLAACGGGGLKLNGTNTSSGSGIGTATATSTSTGTGTKTSRITPQGSCAKLTCLDDLSDLMTDCRLSGDCVMQQVGLNVNICYSNGVKMAVIMTSSGPISMSMTVKNGSKACYTGQVDETSYVLKNTAGKKVATFWLAEMNSDEFPITCADDSAGTLDSSCGSAVTDIISAAGMASECRDGTCK